MKETFTCSDCQKILPRGLDVEKDFFLGSTTMLTRCVYCYNNQHPRNPLNIDICFVHAYNLEHYGVAILPISPANRAWDEILRPIELDRFDIDD